MSREFTQAMRAGDWDRADRLIPDLAATLPDSLLRSIGELRIVQQRFGDAAEAFERMKYRNSDAEMNRKLCRNLACLSVHRPRLYQTLLESKSANCYTVKASITGHPTILFQKPDGNPISMSADNDPLKGVQTAMQSVDAAHRGGKALGLSGIGDGYLLLHLAQNPPELILGRQQAVCVIEPDAQLVLDLPHDPRLHRPGRADRAAAHQLVHRRELADGISRRLFHRSVQDVSRHHDPHGAALGDDRARAGTISQGHRRSGPASSSPRRSLITNL